MKNKNFRDAYMNLPRANNEHVKIRKEIETKCNVSSSVFYNWNTGVTEVPLLAKLVISQILKIDISELFPETNNQIN